jgi:hypothetical protein
MVLGPDLNDRALLLSWAVIDLEPGDFTTFSLDGNYSLWVPSGSYGIGVSLPGYSTFTGRVEVPDGSDIKADFWLDNPQPFSAHAASLQSIGIFSQDLGIARTRVLVLLVYLTEQTEPSSIRPF